MVSISSSIQRYMFMLAVTNAIVGIMSWMAFRMMGLENAGAWAVAAGFTHIVPYFGSVVKAAVTGMAAYMQFDSILMALLVAGTSNFIATIVGVFVTTWMTGRIEKMNSAGVLRHLSFLGFELHGAYCLAFPLFLYSKSYANILSVCNPLRNY